MSGNQSTVSVREIIVPAGRRRLPGILSVPEAAFGVVLFAHGSGSGRLSPRNQFVARSLQEIGLATLLLDLLEEEEAADRQNVFDIELLAGRLGAAADWLAEQQDTRGLPLGLFGASTGAGAALVLAARAPRQLAARQVPQAVVSRGGRPDLALPELAAVKAPTLLIVGGDDPQVLRLNRQALAALSSPKELVVIPGATHLFEEPGTLEEVARLAAAWFRRHLSRGTR
jgi:putative phosphoribosyl transferase